MLWEDENRAERYYKCNFRVKEEEVNSLRVCVVNEYVKGLCWVLCYYFRKCASWDWYYPAHYSPLAEDFFLIEAPNIKFDESAPASPFEQLLSILPPKSADILPPQLRGLLRDENSPLKELCPDQVQIDMTGKRFSWQGMGFAFLHKSDMYPSDVVII